MKHLAKSFQQHVGQRGTHFYDDQTCNFLHWGEVIGFLKTFPVEFGSDTFAEKLTEALANYNPDTEYLAVHQRGSSVSVELYADPGKTTPMGQPQ
jgi:hypothetical protein